MRKKIKQLIESSGKKGAVTYKGKDKRKQFDESVTHKKLQAFIHFVGDKTKVISQILLKK
ncbi:hypothetical protein EG339_13020 [Chryseobacterium bernardetii]|uniref:Uncharacterized protein n=1 Tax=Chryseobacterium bernardetii TaxID=1241978 RepID=A0A3G6TGS9_9FLAO|nr:hypothetical protein [Chryseobacterium bernardetii]AZB25434.1 hypothetical protein EG339_13020 [Chryseobacterium bernardetii]